MDCILHAHSLDPFRMYFLKRLPFCFLNQFKHSFYNKHEFAFQCNLYGLLTNVSCTAKFLYLLQITLDNVPPPVDSKARLIRSVYCFAKDGRSHEVWIIELSSVFACFKSVPFSGELLTNEKSRSICRWGSVSSTRIGLNGTKTAPCHLLRIIQFTNSFLLKLIVRFNHLMVGIRFTSNQRLQSITKAMASLSDTKTPTSSYWSTCDWCSGRISKFSSFRI